MPEPLTREQIYEAIWSKPLRTLAESFGVSDVALAKACHKADIPVPPRGYWAKKSSGKQVVRPPLPPRFPGASDTVEVGDFRSSGYWNSDLLSDSLPSPPIFTEALSSVRERVTKMVGKVPCPQPTSQAHPLIRKLMAQDDVRKIKYEASRSWWDEPWFVAKIDRRRLRILNALFLAMQGLGCKPGITTSQFSRDNRDASFQVGDSHITISESLLR